MHEAPASFFAKRPKSEYRKKKKKKNEQKVLSNGPAAEGQTRAALVGG